MIKLLKSRTTWTAIVMYLINFAPGLKSIVPDEWKPLVDGLLTLGIFYFRANPKVDFNSP